MNESDDLSDINLDVPPTYQREEVLRMLNAFHRACPSVYEEWLEKERHPSWEDGDALKEVSWTVIEFLRSRCRWNASFDLVMAWARMRGAAIEIVAAERRSNEEGA